MGSNSSMGILPNQIPDELKCPICLLIPEGNVLQCVEGHVICENCHLKLTKKQCPQCTSSYGEKGIRNRTLENLLDKLRLDCEFVELGCGVTLTRRNFREHVDNCKLAIPLCKLMGHSSCLFRINRMNLKETIDHMKESHGGWVAQGGTCTVKYKTQGFGSQNVVLQPKIFNLKQHGAIFIVVGYYSRREKTVSWLPVMIPDKNHWIPEDEADGLVKPSPNFEVSFSLFDAVDPEQVGMKQPLLLKWKTTPIEIGMVSRFLPGGIPFKVSATAFGKPSFDEQDKAFSIKMEVAEINNTIVKRS